MHTLVIQQKSALDSWEIVSHMQLFIQVTMEVQSVPENDSDELQKLMESNRRLKNQVISLQGNIIDKKNKLRKLKWRGTCNSNLNGNYTARANHCI